MSDTSQERFTAPPRSPDFEETTSAVTRRVWWCDGHEYENCIEYDLREGFDRMAFEGKLDTFIEWREEAAANGADEVFVVEDGGHIHFRRGGVEVWCNVEEVSKRIRRIYFTVEPIDQGTSF